MKKKSNNKKNALMIMQFILGGFFIYASIGKIFYFEQFLESILSYKLFSYDLAVLIGRIVPWIELILGILLVLGIMERFSVYSINALLIIFILLILITLIRGIDFNCGCIIKNSLSIKKESVFLQGLYAIARDIVLLIFGIYIVRNTKYYGKIK